MFFGSFGENFPYTNFHDLNLDWIIRMMRNLNDKFDNAITSKIQIADPPEWDISRAYGEYTIVFDNNNAYLSTQPVPAGIPITNTEYWIPVFDMDEMEQMIEDLKNNTEKSNNARHILYCGDSYSTMHNQLMYTSFANNSGIPVSQCHNLAVSGASFAESSNTFLNQIANYNGDKNEITDIIVVGGINDALPAYNIDTYPDITALTNAIVAFKNYAETNYPNARLSIAYVGGCMTSSQYYTEWHPQKSQEMAMYAYTVVAQENGYRVLKTYNVIHGTPLYYYTDGLHPSTAGATAIGSAVARAFNNEYAVSFRPEYTGYQAIDSGITRTGTMHYKETLLDDVVNLNIDSFYFYCKENSEVGSNFVEFMDLNTSPFRIKTRITINTTVLLSGFENTANYHPVPASLRFENGKGYISLTEISGQSFKTFVASTNNSAITIPGFNLVMKTIDIN